MVMGLTTPAFAYNWYWNTTTVPTGFVNLAKQQISTSTPDCLYMITEQSTPTTRTTTLYARISDNPSPPYYTIYSVWSYTYPSPYTIVTRFSQPTLTISIDPLTNELFYQVGWIELLRNAYEQDVITAWYWDSRNPNQRQQLTDISYTSDESSTGSSVSRIRYSIVFKFYDPNHYAWSSGKVTYTPESWGSWSYGAGYFEYEQPQLKIKDGSTTKVIFSTPLNTWHQDRACGNWYWSDESDVANGASTVNFRYAPNPFWGTDPLIDAGPDAVAYILNGTLYSCTSVQTTTPTTISSTYTNGTFGIVATDVGTLHVLYPGYLSNPPFYSHGVKDQRIYLDGSKYTTELFYQSPVTNSCYDLISDAVPKPESGTDSFDILGSHWGEDEGMGTDPNTTYVMRIRGGQSTSDIIYEYYAGGYLGATFVDNGNTNLNVAYLPAETTMVFAIK